MTKIFLFYGVNIKCNKNKNISNIKVKQKMIDIRNYYQSKITSKELNKFCDKKEMMDDRGYDMVSRSEAYEKITLKDTITNKRQDFYKDIQDISRGEINILTKNFQKVGVVVPWIDKNIPDDFKTPEDIISLDGEELWEYRITIPELSRLDKRIFREFKYIPHYNLLQETGEVSYNNHK